MPAPIKNASACEPARPKNKLSQFFPCSTSPPWSYPLQPNSTSILHLQHPPCRLPSPAGDDVWSANIGPERAARGWVWNSIARAGGKLAFGSDWPVVTIDPLMGLHVGINRTTLYKKMKKYGISFEKQLMMS